MTESKPTAIGYIDKPGIYITKNAEQAFLVYQPQGTEEWFGHVQGNGHIVPMHWTPCGHVLGAHEDFDLFRRCDDINQPYIDKLQSQIDRLQTQLSGITQYGSVEAAEKIDRLTRELTEAKEAFYSYQDFKAQEIAVLTSERDEAREIAVNMRILAGTGGVRLYSDEESFPWEDKTDE